MTKRGNNRRQVSPRSTNKTNYIEAVRKTRQAKRPGHAQHAVSNLRTLFITPPCQGPYSEREAIPRSELGARRDVSTVVIKAAVS
eukprot:1189899-Prorocentrum_minimum.AAC.1